MLKLAFVFVGGGAGSVLRYLVMLAGEHLRDRAEPGSTSDLFPWETMLVNIVGCLLIGFIAHLVAGRITLAEPLRLAILVGVLGGFTTFSAFGGQTLGLLQSGHTGLALAYVFGSNTLGIGAAWAGHLLAGRL